VIFKELVIIKSVWGPGLYDMGAWTASQIKEVEQFDFEELLLEDGELSAWVDSDVVQMF
jgi:hypothetical protein